MTGTDASDRDAARGATESDVHAPGALGDVPPVSGARLARYAEAIEGQLRGARVMPEYERLVRAVMAVADAEQAELKAEVERLTRWKSEATEVILGLQDLGRALELSLGERITGEAAAEAARTLKAEVERLRAALTRVEEADQRAIHMYSDAMVKWNARAEAAEAALAAEREAHAGLRARLEALADRLESVIVPSAEVTSWSRYFAARLRPILAAEPAEATASRPPETSGAGSIAPVAAEEGDEQEAGEAKCAGVRVEGRMSGMLCDPDGTVRGGLWHHGTDYECTGSAHLGPDEVIVCANPVHDVEWHVPAPSGSDEQGNRPATPDANGVHDTTGGE